ncbi:MAG: VOC family protein [Pseudomonadota bacterium]
MPQGTIHWTELNTHKPAEAAAFFKQTLGWEIDKMERGDLPPYRVGKVGDQMVAGIFDLSELYPESPDIPAHWITYFAVDDADAKADEIVANGGKIIRPPFDVPYVGRFIILHDNVGAVCGFIQPVSGDSQ